MVYEGYFFDLPNLLPRSRAIDTILVISICISISNALLHYNTLSVETFMQAAS